MFDSAASAALRTPPSNCKCYGCPLRLLYQRRLKRDFDRVWSRALYLAAAARRAPLARTRARFGSPCHRVAVNAPAALHAAGGKIDLASAQPATGDLRGIAARLERARDHLKFLLERQFALREPPRTLYFCRHDPQVRRAP